MNTSAKAGLKLRLQTMQRRKHGYLHSRKISESRAEGLNVAIGRHAVFSVHLAVTTGFGKNDICKHLLKY